MKSKVCEVFVNIAKCIEELEEHYPNVEPLDSEMMMDAIIENLSQCIPASDFGELCDLRLNGYGINK